MKYLLPFLAAALTSCMSFISGAEWVTGNDKYRCVARCTYGLLTSTYHDQHMTKYTREISGQEMFKKAERFCRMAYKDKGCWFFDMSAGCVEVISISP